MLRVSDAARNPLYRGQRSSAAAAKLAATEFAVFHTIAPSDARTPEQLASYLDWKEYW
jgi:hypothetical protein